MTPNQQTLLDLATRAEGVAGADRELDVLIRKACFEHGETPTGMMWWVDEKGRTRTFHEMPYWTRSLDAAMSLVPEGWFVRLDDLGADGMPLAQLYTLDQPTQMGIARDLKLCLVAAALRARAATCAS